MGQAIRVLIADAHPLERAGIASIVQQAVEDVILYEADTLSAVESSFALEPAIALVAIDVDLPHLNGLTGIRDLLARHSEASFFAIGEAPHREALLSALATGMQGYLPRNLEAAHVAEAFKTVLDGRIYFPPLKSLLPVEIKENRTNIHDVRRLFTERQLEVIALLVEGNSNKQIARALNISESTVKVHINASFRSLSVHNRRSAIEAFRDMAGEAAPGDHLLDRILQTVREFRFVQKIIWNTVIGGYPLLLASEEYVLSI